MGACVYCGNSAVDTRDHVPSRILLDDPFPENLPVVAACGDCNQGFSLDEEYLACLVECVICGSADPQQIGRRKVARILAHRPMLAARLAAARAQDGVGTIFTVEEERVQSVILKLARGHAAFELDTPQLEEPEWITIVPLCRLSADDRLSFEAGPGSHEPCAWPEVGSRAMQRLVGVGSIGPAGWLIVQPGRYRYRATTTAVGIVVQIVLSEYLACEVGWP